MALLLNHPKDLQSATAELDSVVGHNRLLQDSDVPNLPYLRCIIQETLRLYPSGPIMLPHESSTECTVAGYTVPAGTMLLTNIWALHRDPEAWPEPEKFRPERFEKWNEMEKAEQFKWLPFGAGRRACPGDVLAMRVMGLTLGTFIQCFDWESVGKEKVDMEEGLGITMPMAQPLVAMYRPREEMMHLLPQVLL